MATNPFHAPELPAGPPDLPPAARPASLVVFGVLNIVFGLLSMCGAAGSSVMFFVDLPRDPALPNPMLDLIKSNPTFRLTQMVNMGISIVLAVALMLAGIGLLRSKAWGRTLSVGYGWCAIAGIVLAMIVNWIYLVQPMLANLKQAGGAGGPAETLAMGTAVGGMASGCFGLVYPVILLVFMNRPALRDWLAAGRESGQESLR